MTRKKRDTAAAKLQREIHATCAICGCQDNFDYNVPDKLWRQVVPRSCRNRVVCLKCFDELALRMDIAYAHALDHIYFAGARAVFTFQTVSAHDV